MKDSKTAGMLQPEGTLRETALSRLELCFHELEIQGGMHLYKSIFVYIKDTFTQYRFLFKNMLKTYS